MPQIKMNNSAFFFFYWFILCFNFILTILHISSHPISSILYMMMKISYFFIDYQIYKLIRKSTNIYFLTYIRLALLHISITKFRFDKPFLRMSNPRQIIIRNRKSIIPYISNITSWPFNYLMIITNIIMLLYFLLWLG